MPELSGRTALVTGAGEGIGRAITIELAERGAHVIAVGRRAEKLRETCSVQPAHISPFVGDVRFPETTAELKQIAHTIDVVVHNAVFFPPYGLVEQVDDVDERRAFEVAVFGPRRICGLVLPGMKERGFGRVVFLGSIAATTGAARQSAYAAAKAALMGLARSIALEGAPFGITCNVVEPGLVLTERVLTTIPPETRARLVASTPMKRAGRVEEVAALVAFLCSPRAGFITGATIPVSGGLELGLFPEP